jgi:hypothetical protein
MADLVRMGARVSLAEDQAPMGRAGRVVLTRDETGKEVEREVLEPVPTVLAIVYYVELDDGRRLTTEEFGKMTLETSLDGCREEDLVDEAREYIFEDDLRDIPELAEEPRWEEMREVLRRNGLTVDEEGLARLPFVVELDDRLRDKLKAL